MKKPSLFLSELLKLKSYVITYLALLLAIFLKFISLNFLALGYGISRVAIKEVDIIIDLLSAGFDLYAIVLIIFGILVATADFSSGMINTTLSAVPKRGLVFVTKIWIVCLYTLLITLVMTVLYFDLILEFYSEAAVGEALASKLWWEIFIGMISTHLLVALMGVGLGFMFRSAAVALSVAMGILVVMSISSSIRVTVEEITGSPSPKNILEALWFSPYNAIARNTTGTLLANPLVASGLTLIWDMLFVLGGALIFSRVRTIKN